MKRIGIVGLGIMGRGMAINFLKNGYEVNVWNRTKAVSKGIEGATICDSPQEVAQNSDLIFEVTANDESSKKVWTGEQGILAGATADKVLIISATVSAAWTDELAELCEKDGLKLLDIPLTGGRVGAETGNMTLLCGGDEMLIEELKPIFDAIAGNVFHFGPVGHGMRYKLILNFVQGSHMIAFGQAIRIAKESGMDIAKVAKGLAFRPGGVITDIANSSYFEDPDPITFSIEWITKDLGYAQQLADNLGLKLSVLESTLAEYQKVFDKYKDKDWASVNRIIERESAS